MQPAQLLRLINPYATDNISHKFTYIFILLACYFKTTYQQERPLSELNIHTQEGRRVIFRYYPRICLNKKKQNSRKTKLLVMFQLSNSSSLYESRSINTSEIVGK